MGLPYKGVDVPKLGEGCTCLGHCLLATLVFATMHLQQGQNPLPLPRCAELVIFAPLPLAGPVNFLLGCAPDMRDAREVERAFRERQSTLPFSAGAGPLALPRGCA
jgi:hypothetical protein